MPLSPVERVTTKSTKVTKFGSLLVIAGALRIWSNFPKSRGLGELVSNPLSEKGISDSVFPVDLEHNLLFKHLP